VTVHGSGDAELSVIMEAFDIAARELKKAVGRDPNEPIVPFHPGDDPTDRSRYPTQIGRVLRIIGELAAYFANHGLMLNERYLHHVFSHCLQQTGAPSEPNLLVYEGPTDRIMLHPEWPTYKEAAGLMTGGRYMRINRRTFMPIENGRKGGFIDFAIGNYSSPEIGIEFMLKPSWSNEETVFDFMKLLDSRNSSFKHVVSFGIILRENGLPPDAEVYRRLADEALARATRRLGPFYHQDGRRIYFVITEVASDGRRYLYYDQPAGQFIASPEIPPFLVDVVAIVLRTQEPTADVASEPGGTT
jgi:hypothetical protein